MHVLRCECEPVPTLLFATARKFTPLSFPPFPFAATPLFDHQEGGWKPAAVFTLLKGDWTDQSQRALIDADTGSSSKSLFFYYIWTRFFLLKPLRFLMAFVNEKKLEISCVARFLEVGFSRCKKALYHGVLVWWGNFGYLGWSQWSAMISAAWWTIWRIEPMTGQRIEPRIADQPCNWLAFVTKLRLLSGNWLHSR